MTDVISRVLVAGASGTTGRCVVEALLAGGYQVVAVVRPSTVWDRVDGSLEVVRTELCHEPHWYRDVSACDAIISCLASRTGAAEDARQVEFDANNALLAAAEQWRVQRFLLVSAVCVQKPLLAFQREKLRFETRLRTASVPWTIVRPTAFFNSLSGQVSRVQSGRAFFLFGGGNLTACKPISGHDLADYLLQRLHDLQAAGQVLVIGGPGPALTPKDQVAMLERLMGQPVKTRTLPPAMFRWLATLFTALGWVVPRLRDRAEFLRIAHFYATESMLVWDASANRYCPDQTPETGTERLEDFYRALLAGEASVELREHKLF